MPQPSFRLPDPKPPQPGWGVASAVLHLVVILILLATAGGTVAKRMVVHFIDVGGAPAGGQREYEMRFEIAAPSAPSQAAASQPAVVDGGEGGGGRTVVAAPRVVPIGIPRRELSRHDAVIGEDTLVGRSYGSGDLWVGPIEGRLGVIGPSPDRPTHAARIDSAVQALVYAIVSDLPPDSFATGAPPSWVTEIDGKKWGIDGSWLYLGDLKIPSAIMALLGFLPLPQGNYELMKEEQQLGRVREQIMRQAQMMQTTTDINRYIKEIRKRKDRERAERLAANEPAKRDTIIP